SSRRQAHSDAELEEVTNPVQHRFPGRLAEDDDVVRLQLGSGLAVFEVVHAVFEDLLGTVWTRSVEPDVIPVRRFLHSARRHRGLVERGPGLQRVRTWLLHLATDVERARARDFDNVPGLQRQVQLLPTRGQALEIDDGHALLRLCTLGPERRVGRRATDDVHDGARVGGDAAGPAERVGQAYVTSHGEDAARLHGADDRNPLALVLVDEHGDLRVVHELDLQNVADLRLQLERGGPAGGERTDQRQRHLPTVWNPKLDLRELRDIEDRDLDEVPGAEPGIGRL